MRTVLPVLVLAAALGLSGCAPTDSTLKGKVVEGGQPVELLGGEQVSLTFYLLEADGSPSKSKIYTAVVQPSGGFEFIASGGRLPPGKYRVVIAGSQAGPPTPGKDKKPKPVDRFAGHSTLAESKITIDVQPGTNEVVVDLKAAG